MIGKFRIMFLEEEKQIKESWKRTFRMGILDVFSVCGELVNHIVYPGNDLIKYL
ncbi:hypothetical protein [Terrisporobacter mayombei]|uniref:hypothetical protein n=1 Tax=Terrisporobacter mayombei TaxID=1541 RepID=UPI001D15E531|nr:hypothetical protein [Terrisporobacter mayombei]